MNDLVNGLFEAFGGLFVLLSILRLRRDRCVRGVSWAMVAYFTTWGFYNLYFYPSVDCWASFAGGLFVVVANTTYLSHLLWFTFEEKHR